MPATTLPDKESAISLVRTRQRVRPTRDFSIFIKLSRIDDFFRTVLAGSNRNTYFSTQNYKSNTRQIQIITRQTQFKTRAQTQISPDPAAQMSAVCPLAPEPKREKMKSEFSTYYFLPHDFLGALAPGGGLEFSLPAPVAASPSATASAYFMLFIRI